MRIIRIMKIIEIHMITNEHHENVKNTYENHKSHEHFRNHIENHANLKILRHQHEN